MEDFSVSRDHAVIKLKKDQVTLKDKYSKFGTQYLLKPPIKIRENKMFLQVGKTIFEIYGEKIKKKSSFLCWGKHTFSLNNKTNIFFNFFRLQVRKMENDN